MSQQFNVEAILAKFPDLIKDQERQLPIEQRNELVKKRVAIMIQQQQAKARKGSVGGQPRPPGQVPGQPGTPQTQPVRPPTPVQAGPSQSPRVGMQQINGQQVQMTPAMLAQLQQQAAAQAQAQGGNQQQQQQQFQNMLAAQQRLQHQAMQQMQGQPQQQGTPQQQAAQLAPTPQPGVGTPMTNQLSAAGIATPSPQANQSPMANAGMLSQSPVTAPRMQPGPSGGAGPGISNAPTPVPVQPQQGGGMGIFGQDLSKLVTQMPELIKMRQQGLMNPEMQKTFDTLMATPEVKQYLQNYQARQANNIRQNLVNNITTAQGNQQSQPTALLAAQQIAHLQQQQQRQQLAARQQAAALGNLGPEALAQFTQQQLAQLAQQQHGQQLMNAQLHHQQQLMQQQMLQQQNQHVLQQQPQLLMRQQQLANQGMRTPSLGQAQLPNGQNILQGVQHPQAAQVLQAQALLQQQQAAGVQFTPQQAQQLAQAAAMANVNQQNVNGNFGSPRPPQQQQGQAPATSIAEIRQKLQLMSDADREKAFEKTPKLRALFYGNLNLQTQQLAMQQAAANQQVQTQAQALQAAQAQAQAQVQAQQNQIQAQQAQQQQIPGGTAQPGAVRPPGTPQPVGFPVFNSATLPNLQIPPGKQRNVAAAQAQGVSTGPGSPQVRPPTPVAAQQAPNRLFGAGIPISMTGQTPVRPTMAGLKPFQVAPGQQVTPAHILSDLDKQNVVPTAQPVQSRTTNELVGTALDRSGSLLMRASYTPTAESDAALRDKLYEPYQPPGRQAGRATLLEGLTTVPVLANVLGERLPADLRALADGDTDVKDVSLDKGKKHDLEGGGMPGQKRQKVQEFAEGIDKSFEIQRPVEDVLLSLTDEYVDLVSQTSCQLAKHRKSATIDRKDVQFAYESLFGRTLPGFSSDAIRLDQARSSRRAASSQRATKLKLVNDAKLQWRKDKEEAIKAAEASAIEAQAKAAMLGNGEMTAPASVTIPTISLPNGSASGGTTAVPSVNGTPLPTLEITAPPPAAVGVVS